MIILRLCHKQPLINSGVLTFPEGQRSSGPVSKEIKSYNDKANVLLKDYFEQPGNLMYGIKVNDLLTINKVNGHSA